MPKLSKRNFRRGSQRSAMVSPLKERLAPTPIKERFPPRSLLHRPARKPQRWPRNGLAAGRLVLWEKQFGCAIRSTGKFVTRQLYLVCGGVPSDSHHLTFTQPRAFGHRASGGFTVPVCRIHHRELHRSGDEAAWWDKLNIDPVPVALRLWRHTRADGRNSRIEEGVTQTARAPAIAAQERGNDNLDPNPS